MVGVTPDLPESEVSVNPSQEKAEMAGMVTEEEFSPYHYVIDEDYKSDMTSSVPSPPKCCYKRKIGRMYVCCEDPVTKKPSCLWGACWPMTFVTWSLVIIPVVITASLSLPVLEGWPLYIGWVATILVVLIFSLALFLTGFRNPGIFKRERVRQEGWTWHEASKSFRPIGVVYCSESHVLVHNIDHFCPWSGTVIARDNLMPFNVFTSFVCVAIFYIPIMLLFLLFTEVGTRSG